jgi:alpha/beta superfamily hydrolase
MSVPGRNHRLTIEGPVGVLETILDDTGAADEGGSYAVICHPHPLFGGTMDNKVVATLARAMNLCGIPSLRFNYRGVEGSAGSYDEGLGESADADAVAAWGADRFPGRRLIAAGFSFGAVVALRLNQRRSLSRLIMVAPPVYRFGMAELPTPTVPWLIVQGDADDVVDVRKVAAWADTTDPKPRLIVMPGVGHFFHGHLNELREAVVNEIRNG